MKRKSPSPVPLLYKVNRRDFLSFIGSSTVVSLFGCARSSRVESTPSRLQAQPIANSLSDCTASPEQTEGPFFIEEALNRTDIRSDPFTGDVSQGIPLRLKLRVSQANTATCTPIAGAVVDVWHCNADGVYSDVGTATGQKFLRGSQMTDAEGLVEFITIYPGWYPGRAPHIHIKVRSGADEFASQLYFNEAVSDRIYAQSPYNRRKQRSPKNENDFIYQDGGEQLLLDLNPSTKGYVGTFRIGLLVG